MTYSYKNAILYKNGITTLNTIAKTRIVTMIFENNPFVFLLPKLIIILPHFIKNTE